MDAKKFIEFKMENLTIRRRKTNRLALLRKTYKVNLQNHQNRSHVFIFFHALLACRICKFTYTYRIKFRVYFVVNLLENAVFFAKPNDYSKRMKSHRSTIDIQHITSIGIGTFVWQQFHISLNIHISSFIQTSYTNCVLSST